MPPPLDLNGVQAPIPVKTPFKRSLLSDSTPPILRCNSSAAGLNRQEVQHSPLQSFRAVTPSIEKHIHNRRKPSYSKIEISREQKYNLDYPDDSDELFKLQLDETSRFYSRSRPRTLNLPKLLPYETETPKEQAKYLSHIVSHLYIAIKTLDIQGSLVISAKDLAALQNITGVSDVDLALETDLFDADSDFDHDDDEEDYDEEDDNSDDEDDDANDGSSSNRQISPKSAAVVSVRHWTAELKTWIKMKFDMPVTLRICLAKIYYTICLTRGQYINLKIYSEMFSLLVDDKHLMQSKGLRLKWEPLYKEIENHFPNCDSSLDVFEKKNQGQLSQLAIEANRFFDDNSLHLIFKKIGSKFSIPTASLTLCSLYALLPPRFTSDANDEDDIRLYIPSLFHLWATLAKSQGIDSHITSLIGKIADNALAEKSINKKIDLKFGKHGIFYEEQMETLFSGLMNNLGISSSKFGSNSGVFFHGYAAAFIFSINGEQCLEANGIMSYIENIANAIKSYVHPSNTGEWSSIIPKLISAIVYQYHKRFNMEENDILKDLPDEMKLTRKITSKLVSIFLPLVNIGLQSKKKSVAASYMKTLSTLAFLEQNVVLESVLLDLYESLEGVISTHRVNVALSTISVLARYFASAPIFRVHITRLLTLALPGIDSNDLDKTLLTLHLFACVSSFVPFYDLTNGMGDSNLAMEFTQGHIEYLQQKIYSKEECGAFQIDEELEIEALKSSSTAFKDLVRLFCERIFIVIENLPDPARSKGAEKTITSSLPKRLTVLFESLSDDIFEMVANKFFTFISENVYYTTADATGNICGAIVKRNRSQFKRFADHLIPRIREDIEENGAGKSRNVVEVLPRDQPLFWNIIILNSCIGNAGEAVLPFSKELVDLSFYLMGNVKGPASYMSSFLVHQVLTTTTKIRLNNTRIISPSYEMKYGVTAECWGGFQFDDYRFSDENLEFDWHIPSLEEIEFAVEFFNSHASKILDSINTLMSKTVESKKARDMLEITDDFRQHLLYLGCAMSGISFLLDPSFEEKIPKADTLENQSLEKRLLLIKKLRKVAASGGSMGLSESRIDDIHENLQRIVDDLNGDYIKADPKSDGGNVADAIEDAVIDEDDQKVTTIPALFKNTPSPSMSNNYADLLSPSEPPSGRGTPQLDQMSDISAMNPSITFREQKLYCSHYLFGDESETRKENELYSKVHKIRSLIGKSLHMIFNFLEKNHHDNVSISKIFLHTLRIWMCDVGSENVLNHSDNSSISYGYMYSIQHINRVRKPFTRLGLAARAELYHRQRVLLHASSRIQTELDRVLLQDIVKLSTSNYMDIAKPAQVALMGSMGKLIGSYNVIMKCAFKRLDSAINRDDHKEITTALRIFNLKKIKNKIQNDFVNIKEFISLLMRCMKIDNLIINESAQKLYKNIGSHLNIPSSTCLIDIDTIECIRPPDEFIDLEIKAIRVAKSKKKEFYSSRLKDLQTFVLESEKENSHWKVTSLNLTMLINNQLDIEVDINNEILVLLVKEATGDHPLISRLCLKGISKILTKITNLGLYEYNKTNMYDFSYIPYHYEIINTKPSNNGSGFSSAWQKELTNTKSPNFYLDNKANIGWLFWDDELKVIKKDHFASMNLRDTEIETLNIMGQLIDKVWLTKVIKMLVSDNETNSAFQGVDVFLTSGISHMIAAGYISNFSFDELLDVVKETYVKDEKSVHVVVCELLCGLLISSKVITSELASKRDDFISEMLGNILESDLSPDNKGVWNIFAWWLPVHVDTRRFPKVINKLLDFQLDPGSDLAFREATRLSFIKSFITSITWKYGNASNLIDECFNNIAHPYQAVREQVGSLIAVLSFVSFNESYPDLESFVEANKIAGHIGAEVFGMNERSEKLDSSIREAFKNIEIWRVEVIHLSSQEILKSDYFNASLTILNWLKQVLNTSSSVGLHRYVPDMIILFLFNLFNMREVCQLADISPPFYFKKLSQIPFRINHLGSLIDCVVKYCGSSLTSIQLIVLLDFIETFYFRNLLSFTKEQRLELIKAVSKLLYHTRVDVRDCAAKSFSGLIHISPISETEPLIKSLINEYSAALDKAKTLFRKKKVFTNEDTIHSHAACLGLGSLILACTYESPLPVWVPNALTILANKSSHIPGSVGKTSKSILSEFKKTRQDSWRIDSKVFSEDQLQDLEGVLWKSYFI